MKSYYAIVCAVLTCLFCNSAFGGPINQVCGTTGNTNEWTYCITPSVGPDPFGSASLLAWQGNALAALASNAATYGTSGLPSYYSAAPGTIPYTSLIATGYNSWLGLAGPLAPPFDGEYGNELFFGLQVTGPSGTPFEDTRLSATVTSTDSADYFSGASFASGGSLLANSYTQSSGSSLTYEGVGMAFQPLDPMEPMANLQSDVSNLLNGQTDTITVCYSISDTDFQNVCAQEPISPTPEPGTNSLLGLGLAGMLVMGRRLARRLRA